MNVLETLKGAINNAHQVGSSIKSLKPKKNALPKTYSGVEGVDIDAGADLLNKFQDQWAEMHQHAEHNAKAAQRLSVVLQGEYEQCKRQAETTNQLINFTSTLPHLLSDITKLTATIDALQEKFQCVEAALVMLVDFGEAVEVRKKQLHHHRQLSDYTIRKAADLEHVKVTFAGDHARRVEGYEAQLQEHLRVKQEAFEEAFAKEMQNYRESGSTDMKPLLVRSAQDVELSEISIEQDNSALNAFLDSTDGTLASSPEDEDNMVAEEEEDEDEERLVHVAIISDYISDPEVDDSLSAVGKRSQCADKEQPKEELQTDTADSATKSPECVSVSSTSENEAEAEVVKAEKAEVEKAEVESAVPVQPAAS